MNDDFESNVKKYQKLYQIALSVNNQVLLKKWKKRLEELNDNKKVKVNFNF